MPRQDATKQEILAKLESLRQHNADLKSSIAKRQAMEERIKEEKEKRRNVVINTTHLIHTPVTIIKGNLELVRKGKKELTPELLDMLIRTAEELSDLVVGELYDNIEKMCVPTSDGFTPVDGEEK